MWCELGYAFGGIVVGITTDVIDQQAATFVVAALTAASVMVVASCKREGD